MSRSLALLADDRLPLLAHVGGQVEVVPDIREIVDVHLGAEVGRGPLAKDLLVDPGAVLAVGQVVLDPRSRPAHMVREGHDRLGASLRRLLNE